MKIILTYHSIDDSGSVISVAPATFRAHIKWLAGSGVQVVPLETLARLPNDTDAIALTFDDAFANFAGAAWPLLREHRLPVTLFVVTEQAGRTNHWSSGPVAAVPRLPLLSWPALTRLAADGVTIGSHTRTHADLRAVSSTQLQDEIEGAANSIGDMVGARPASFAYPYGGFDANSVATVARVHALACTTELRDIRATDHPHMLPRLDAYYFRRPGLLEAFGSGRFRSYLWLRAGGRRIRQALMSAR